MRILFLARSLETGGAERQLGTLSAGLRARGHEVAIAVFYGGGALEAVAKAAGVAVIPLGKRSRWDLLGFTRRAAAAIRRFDPDIVYAFLVAANLLSVALRPLVPRARVVWGLRASQVDWSRYDRFQGFTLAISRAAARFADTFVVNSHAGAAHHASLGFPAASLHVVVNGIDIETFRPDRALGEAQRARWGFTRGERVYGIVARLDPMKDHPTFFDAAARVASAQNAARFVAIGSGPEAYAASLKRHPAVKRLGGRLVWAGEVSDMAAAYNALDALVLSSTGEGFPNAAAEAMACGVPCAVTDAGDAARIVGGTGRVVPPGDPEALAAAMMDLPPAPLPAARERIARDYSVEAMCAATEKLLRNVAMPERLAASGGSA